MPELPPRGFESRPGLRGGGRPFCRSTNQKEERHVYFDKWWARAASGQNVLARSVGFAATAPVPQIYYPRPVQLEPSFADPASHADGKAAGRTCKGELEINATHWLHPADRSHGPYGT